MSVEGAARRSRHQRGGKIVALQSTFQPKFWEHADGRCVVVREIRRRVDELANDCGADTAAKRILCARAAFIALRLETLEREAVDGGKIDFGSYIQACNGLVGLLRTLGLERQAKRVVDLRGYLNGRKERA